MKIQLKRSNQLDGTAAKEPTADQMEYGELAVNYNDSDPALFLKGNDNTIIRIAGKGAAGLEDDYVNITGDTMTGQLVLPGGGSAADAIQKQEVETLIAAIPAPNLTPYVEKAGSTMTGQLTLPGAGSNADAIQKQEVETLIAAIPAPDLTPYVEKTGDTMTGQLTLPGGGSAAAAIQKQEVQSLISAIDFTPYVQKAGSTMTGQLTLPGGGAATAAIQKQEVQSLISAIPAPNLTAYVEKAGSTMTGTLTVPDVVVSEYLTVAKDLTVTGVINNPSIVKAWATCNTSGANQAQGTVFPHTGVNVASCVKSNNLGRYQINFSTAVSSAAYAVTTSNTAVNTTAQVLEKTTGGFIVQHSLASGNQLVPINVLNFDVMVCAL